MATMIYISIAPSTIFLQTINSCKCENFGTELAPARFFRHHWSIDPNMAPALAPAWCLPLCNFLYVQNMYKIDYCAALFISRDSIEIISAV